MSSEARKPYFRAKIKQIFGREEEDIIIKCHIEEMAKHFFKEYVIVWHDPNVNSQENKKYLDQLKKFCKVKTFTEWENAANYISETKETCHVITSGTDGEVLVREINQRENVLNIYIFCLNIDYHSTWAKNYGKVSCIEILMKDVVRKIDENLTEWYKNEHSFRRNFPAFASIFNDYDKSSMNNLHRYLKVIPNFKNRSQAKSDFVALSKAIFLDQKDMLMIRRFERNYTHYNKKDILQWYTQESFLYKAVNNCLRIASSDSIQYCRFLLKDIETAIQEQYKKESKNFNGLLYRGAYLSEDEWSSLKANKGKEIEMHGFLSASKDPNVALDFVRQDLNRKVLIKIIVPKGLNEEEQGFAELEEFSRNPDEKEILFNVRSRFTVLECSDELPYRHLVLFYGAQGFRRFITEKDPLKKVLIKNDLSCDMCDAKTAKMFFVTLTSDQSCVCYQCLDKYLETEKDPLLCLPPIKEAGDSILKIRGFRLTCPVKIPFYGYKCNGCQLEKGRMYFKCTKCDEKWCKDCFEERSSCVEARHVVILENSAFGFWCESMSKRELNHIEFQNELMKKNDQIFQQAEMYLQSNDYQKASQYYESYIRQNEKKQDENFATAYDKLGGIQKHQGDYMKAFESSLKCLEIRKAIYGEDHPETASSYNNIGSIHDKKGEYKDALEYYFKCLAIKRSAYGEEHHETATCYNNIGSIYSRQKGESQKALEYYLRCLEIRMSVYGEDHPETARSYNNVGSLYSSQKEYREALACYSKSLEIRISVHGDNHPETAISYNNLGSLYSSLKDYEKALEFSFKSLEIRKSVYGEQHHETMSSYQNIGSIYFLQGEYTKALDCYLKCFEIKTSMAVVDPLEIAGSYHNIGSIYASKGEYKKALKYYVRSLEIRRGIYGSYHRETVSSYEKIESLDIKDFSEVELKLVLAYTRESWKIKQSFYGGSHPETNLSYQKIASIYSRKGEFEKAFKLAFKCLGMRRLAYGERHPEIARSFDNIGSIHEQMGEYDQAFEYYFKSLRLRENVYAENHPEIAVSYKNIASVYFRQGEYRQASEWNSKCLKVEGSNSVENRRKEIITPGN